MASILTAFSDNPVVLRLHRYCGFPLLRDDEKHNRNTCSMSCTCGSDEISKKKLQILQKKYDELRRNHRKLVGVTVELTEALEGFASGKRPDVNNTLSKCSEIYPNLFEKNNEAESKKIESRKEIEEPVKVIEENQEEKKENGAQEESPEQVPDSEKEYFEGFWSRPRILRTPQ